MKEKKQEKENRQEECWQIKKRICFVMIRYCLTACKRRKIIYNFTEYSLTNEVYGAYSKLTVSWCRQRIHKA